MLKEKRNYILHIATSEIDGTEIYDGENYPTFPIIPLWCNQNHQSELIGIREAIDSYDLIKSGFANDLDQASMITGFSRTPEAWTTLTLRGSSTGCTQSERLSSTAMTE